MNQLEELVKETLASSDALALEESRLASSLRWIERQTNTRTNHAQMLVGLKEGLFLREFARRNSCRRVLEIGTFTGYSLACLADGVISASGIAKRSKEVFADAIEKNRELDYIIEEGLQRAGVSELVKVFFGDAIEVLSSKSRGEDNGIAEEYDLVFIDADKRQYPQYYELVLPLVRPGGYILADNVSWYGKGTEKENFNNPVSGNSGKNLKTAGIRSFNSMIENDDRVESHLVDIRDGLLVIRRK